jgi:radical SAM protein with 4Fe4S-binding SPASM domain
LEHFGAIVQLAKPRALVFVDRDYARSLGVDESPLWKEKGGDGEIGARPLVAPLEAHLQITNRCDAGCQGCYTAATPHASREWPLEKWKKAVDTLAEMGVFHLALGGGESADLPWLGELVAYARSKGMVPNLTTSGLSNLQRVLDLAPLFGQINVSLDGLGADYQAVRGFDGFAQADRAIRELRARSSKVGINVVVTRHNFDKLDEILAYAAKRGLNEVELLRFKPAGRGIQAFSSMTCSDEQHREFLPVVLAGARRHRLRVRVDCSYMPMLAHHKPSRELLASLAVYGCTGGDFLIGAKATGQVTACSFAAAPEKGPTVDALAAYWTQDDAFGAFRTWRSAQEPCRSCDYHELCRGGCKVVSRQLLGDESLPDPECPRVIDQKQRNTLPVLS